MESRRETSIDVSGLGLTSEDITNGAVRSIVNSHPEFIGISGGYTYWTAGNSVTAVDFTYLTTPRRINRHSMQPLRISKAG